MSTFLKNCFILLLVSSIHSSYIKAGNLPKAPILNGEVAHPGEIPYAVAVMGSDRGLTCGGGIIGERFILTAAHCVTIGNEFNPSNFSIIAGTNDLANDFDPNAIEISVEKIFILRDYNLDIRKADIAVLKLVESLDLEKNNLQKLSLPAKNEDIYAVGKRAVVAGFGAKDIELIPIRSKKEIANLEFDGKLRYANVEIVSDSEFEEIPHDDFDLGEYHFLAKMMKNISEPYGMCYGDSGSPMVYKSKVAIGITVEMFDNCDEHVYPSMYTKVTHYLDFLKNALMDIVTEDMRVRVL